MAERILVVDGEVEIREIVSAILTAAGYACKQAGSHADALAILNSGEEFELLLCDLMRTEVDGINLLERTKDKYLALPVVIVTAVHDVSVALAAIRNGAYDYLVKPFEREQLLNAVGRALETRLLRLENRTNRDKFESLVQARTAHLQASMSDLERSYDITLQHLGDSLDIKDAETGSHSRRVTAFSIVIARAMGIPREQIAVIARAAFLHDIGKMAIPDRILLKPGGLDPDERAIIHEHCYRGYQMVKKIPFLAEACETVYSHHEHYDGSGYPRGLRSKEIPLGARIVAVANTLDSILSNLPYRSARSLSEARREIQAWAGRQFDPEVVGVFMKIPDLVFIDMRRKIEADSGKARS
jgi:putative nucleotidyltransferase with HDIG domain